jgi:hypothetical protein
VGIARSGLHHEINSKDLVSFSQTSSNKTPKMTASRTGSVVSNHRCFISYLCLAKAALRLLRFKVLRRILRNKGEECAKKLRWEDHIKDDKPRQAGHETYMEERRNAHKILVRLIRDTASDKHRRRWADNIKMNITEKGCELDSSVSRYVPVASSCKHGYGQTL